MRHEETGIDDQGLAWREHFLSEMIRRSGSVSLLTWEPVPDRTAKNVFTVMPDKEISWAWGEWDFADVMFGYGEEKTSELRLERTEPSSIRLDNVTHADTVEVTLRIDGKRTASVKQKLSDKVIKRLIHFEKKTGGILVSVDGNLPLEGLTIEKYYFEKSVRSDSDKQEIIKYYFLHQETVKFDGKSRILLSAPYSPYLAIVRQTPGGKKMLHCIGIAGNKLVPVEAEREEPDLRSKIEATPVPSTASPLKLSWNEWLQNWSRISQQKYLWLAELAMELLELGEVEARAHTQGNSIGLFRALVLTVLGCPNFKSREWGFEALSGEDFLTSIGLLKKGLAEILDLMPTLEEKIWAIIHAENECLAQTVKSVAVIRLPTLKRELHLLENRRDAIQARRSMKKSVGSQ